MAQSAPTDLNYLKQLFNTWEDKLQCAICIGPFQEPVALNCLHSFCKSCIELMMKTLNTRKLACPTCRKVTFIYNKSHGAEQLIKNWFIEDIYDKIRKTQAFLSRQEIRNLTDGTATNDDQFAVCVDHPRSSGPYANACTMCIYEMSSYLQKTAQHALIYDAAKKRYLPLLPYMAEKAPSMLRMVEMANSLCDEPRVPPMVMLMPLSSRDKRKDQSTSGSSDASDVCNKGVGIMFRSSLPEGIELRRHRSPTRATTRRSSETTEANNQVQNQNSTAENTRTGTTVQDQPREQVQRASPNQIPTRTEQPATTPQQTEVVRRITSTIIIRAQELEEELNDMDNEQTAESLNSAVVKAIQEIYAHSSQQPSLTEGMENIPYRITVKTQEATRSSPNTCGAEATITYGTGAMASSDKLDKATALSKQAKVEKKTPSEVSQTGCKQNMSSPNQQTDAPKSQLTPTQESDNTRALGATATVSPSSGESQLSLPVQIKDKAVERLINFSAKNRIEKQTTTIKSDITSKITVLTDKTNEENAENPEVTLPKKSSAPSQVVATNLCTSSMPLPNAQELGTRPKVRNKTQQKATTPSNNDKASSKDVEQPAMTAALTANKDVKHDQSQPKELDKDKKGGKNQEKRDKEKQPALIWRLLGMGDRGPK